MTDVGAADIRGAVVPEGCDGRNSAPRFGDLLRRLRTARRAAVRHWRGNEYRLVTDVLSMNELARRAGVNPALVHRLEHGSRWTPRRDVVNRFASALELDEQEHAQLLVAAGYWPWPELSDDETALALGVLLAVAAGDCRRVAALQW